MKVLYTITIYPPAVGGAQIHLHQLALQMQALGHGTQVLTHTTRNRRDWVRLATICSERPAEGCHEGIAVRRLGLPWSGRVASLPWALAYYPCMGPSVRRIAGRIGREFVDLPGDIGLVHASRLGREFLTRASLDFARQRRIPFVLTPNHHPRWRGPLYREYDKIYREADAVLALTEAEREMLVSTKGVAADRVHVTGIGPVLSNQHSAAEFRTRYGIEGRFLLFLGQQLPYKGMASIVEAAPQVWRQHPDVRMVFIGPTTPYSRRLFSGDHDRRLINLGKVDLETKTSALSACEFLCVPSLQESFGGVYVEAWSLGKTVIGGRIPPIASVIDDGNDGLLSSQSPTEVAQQIGQLLSDPERCQAMGQAGWKKVQQKYTWEVVARRTLDVYRSLGVDIDDLNRSFAASGASLPACV